MFIEKNDAVHPTVQFLKDTYDVTWGELGKILSQRMGTLGYETAPSAANIRNFATSRSSAWWFWPCISELVIGFWEMELEESTGEQESRQADLKYSYLFSSDLQAVYSFWHSVQDLPTKERESCSIVHTGQVLANSVLNDHERFFKVKFPNITGNREIIDADPQKEE